MSLIKNIATISAVTLALVTFLVQPASAAPVNATFDIEGGALVWNTGGGLTVGSSPVGNLKGDLQFSGVQADSGFDSMLGSSAPIMAQLVFDTFLDWNGVLKFSQTFASGADLVSSITSGFTLFSGNISSPDLNFSDFDAYLHLDLANDAFQFIASIDGLTDDEANAAPFAPLGGNVALQNVTTTVPAPSTVLLLACGLLGMALVRQRHSKRSNK